MDFALKSKCQAAQFIKEFYPKYINEHQIQYVSVEAVQSNDEVLRLINEHQAALDEKHKRHYSWILWSLGLWIFAGYFKLLWEILEIKDLLKK